MNKSQLSLKQQHKKKTKVICFILVWFLLISVLVGLILYKNKQITINGTLAKRLCAEVAEWMS